LKKKQAANRGKSAKKGLWGKVLKREGEGGKGESSIGPRLRRDGLKKERLGVKRPAK